MTPFHLQAGRDWVQTAADTGIVTVAGAIIVAALTIAFNAAATRRRERRERYAAMTETLTAWSELPYRIRRRTSNDGERIDALVARMSDLQEHLSRDHALLRSECQWLADRRAATQRQVQSLIGPYIREAWDSPPATSTSAMNLNGWGPTGASDIISSFSADLRWRFGWRRVLAPFLKRRAAKLGCAVEATTPTP
jgi:hypothetical protein